MGCGGEGCIGPTENVADLWIKILDLLTELAEKNCDLDVKHVKAHRTEEEKQAMTNMKEFVMKGNEKAEGLAKEGTDVDEGQMAAAKALTVKQSRKYMYASIG